MKLLTTFIASFGFLVLTACGGDSVDSITNKWCKLNMKVKTAATPEEKEIAKMQRKAYERKIDEKHGNDEQFMRKLKKATQQCD